MPKRNKTIIDAQLLREVMIERAINGKTLAAAAEVSPQFISQLLLGQRRSTREETADKIEFALGLASGTIFRDGLSQRNFSTANAP